MTSVGRLIRVGDGAVIVDRLSIADTFWSRLIGLQFRRPLPANKGVLIVPCSAVHTAFVLFAIDVVFLDAEGCVVGIRRGLRPWSVASSSQAYAVLEVLAGTLSLVKIGDKLSILPASPARFRPPFQA